MRSKLAAILMSVFLAACAWPGGDETWAVGASDQDMVVVVHGLGRSKVAMWWLAGKLEDAGYRVARIGYQSLHDTPDEILADIKGQISQCCLETSPNLHFVGHSLGGLLIRAHLTDNRPDNLGRVVLIGTPNTGSEIVDNLGHKWWFKVLGPMAKALGTKPGSFPSRIGPPDYPIGVIAGIKSGNANDDHLPGDDDGLVTVASTKFEGMTDFVIVESGHSAMRYDDNVLRHTLRFLKVGKFDRP